MSYKDIDSTLKYFITTTFYTQITYRDREGVKLSEIKYVDNLSLYDDETILRGVGKNDIDRIGM